MSATFRIVCLKAQTIESNTSLNWAGGIFKRAEKYKLFILLSVETKLKKKVLWLVYKIFLTLEIAPSMKDYQGKLLFQSKNYFLYWKLNENNNWWKELYWDLASSNYGAITDGKVNFQKILPIGQKKNL